MHRFPEPALPPFMSYAAKFVCGVQTNDVDVVRGVYATTINVHNPQATISVTYFKKTVIALPESSKARGQISSFVSGLAPIRPWGSIATMSARYSLASCCQP